MCVFGGRKLSTNGKKFRFLVQYAFVDQWQTYEVRNPYRHSRSQTAKVGDNMPPYSVWQPTNSEHVAAKFRYITTKPKNY